MESGGKPEVNLEIFGGFFRIPTENLIYNISVISGQEPQPVRVVERIVEVEKKTPSSAAPPVSAPAKDTVCLDVATEASRELAGIATGLGALYDAAEGMGAAAEPSGQGFDAGALSELEARAASLAENLSDFRNALETVPGPVVTGGGAAPSLDAGIALVREHLERARDTALALREGGAAAVEAPPPPPPVAEKMNLYLFDLDVIFQTLYELCTNETVKGHISGARQKADSIFDARKVREVLTERVKGMMPDDGFLNVPISDVTQAMVEGCQEKPIQNLLKKMDSSQTSIFLDTILPLPEPEKEEVEMENVVPEIISEPPAQAASDPRIEELAGILDEGLTALSELEEKATASAGLEEAMPSGGGATVDFTALDAALDSVRKLMDGLGGLSPRAGTGKGAAGMGGAAGERIQSELVELCRRLLAMAVALNAAGEHGPGEDAGSIMDAARHRTGKVVHFEQDGGAAGVRRALGSLGLRA